MAALIRFLPVLLARPDLMLVWIVLGIVGLAAMGGLAPKQAGLRLSPPTDADRGRYSQPPYDPFAEPPPPPARSPPEPPYVAKPGSTLAVARNSFQDWHWDNGDPLVFKVGAVRWTGTREPEGGAFVRLQAPGRKARTFWFDSEWGIDVAIGRLDMGRPGPQMIVGHFTGGFHCCMGLIIISPHGDGWREEKIGAWEQMTLGDKLTDHDGDGWPDFEVSDDRFDYRFEGHASSYVPTRMVQVRNGKLVDISRRPVFRRHFEAQMVAFREVCEKERNNSACAAFVAVASRLGRHRWAWKIMLRSHNPENTLGVSYECDPRGRIQHCLEPDRVNYRNFPTALKVMLKDTGYL